MDILSVLTVALSLSQFEDLLMTTAHCTVYIVVARWLLVPQESDFSVNYHLELRHLGNVDQCTCAAGTSTERRQCQTKAVKQIRLIVMTVYGNMSSYGRPLCSTVSEIEDPYVP